VRRYDVVNVGMGSGGIVAAEFAASLGLRVAAVERERSPVLWSGGERRALSPRPRGRSAV
jgi:pyruvate/2-oxoglutarate dehydrogenase complex dihydrolipoamide dehydrogenase (E3) component